jgi:putative hydrolase of HD superfamily
MSPEAAAGVLAALRLAGRLKDQARSGLLASGRAEGVAEHSWRVALLGLLLAEELAPVDLGRLLALALVHDLGEALSGDVPAPRQAGDAGERAAREARDVAAVFAPLPEAARGRLLALWSEAAAAQTREARLLKGLDRLETLTTHTDAEQAPGFDHGFNLGYGRAWTEGEPAFAALRALLDAATRERMR